MEKKYHLAIPICLLFIMTSVISAASDICISTDTCTFRDTSTSSDILFLNIENQTHINITMDYSVETVYDDYFTVVEMMIKEQMSENIIEGVETIFDGNVTDFEINSYNHTIKMDFLLKKSTDELTISKIPAKYTNYLPLHFDFLIISLNPEFHFHSIAPGPNNYTDKTIIYEGYDWNPEFEIVYGKSIRITKINPERIRPKIRIETPVLEEQRTLDLPIEQTWPYGKNNHSRYLIPYTLNASAGHIPYRSYVGNDNIPETHINKTALEVAEMYVPYFVYGGGSPDDEGYKWCPDNIYYRIVHGWDPYANRMAYLIIYYNYYKRQCCTFFFVKKNHENDQEPVFVWVEEIGEQPYRVVYDRWTIWDIHFHQVHRTYWQAPVGHYEGSDLDPVYTQSASYFPQGYMIFTGDSEELNVGNISDIPSPMVHTPG